MEINFRNEKKFKSLIKAVIEQGVVYYAASSTAGSAPTGTVKITYQGHLYRFVLHTGSWALVERTDRSRTSEEVSCGVCGSNYFPDLAEQQALQRLLQEYRPPGAPATGGEAAPGSVS